MAEQEQRLENTCCDVTIIHEDVIERVRSGMPAEEELFDLAEFFKVFGDTTRIRILYALFQSEMCVCDLAHLMDLPNQPFPTSSGAETGEAGGVRREGRVVYYSLADDHVKSIFDQGYQHIQERN